jgi:hypothetical protein
MSAYGIYQEPGLAARRRHRWTPPCRRVGRVEQASCAVEALAEFIHFRYIAPWNRQYDGHHTEWRTARNDTWRPWNGTDDPGTRGREWRAVVTLRNGHVNTHDIYLHAWKEQS